MERARDPEEFDPRLGLYRWRVEQGAWLLTEPPATSLRRRLRVVALGGGTGLPVVLEGLKDALFPSGPAWAQTADRHRLAAVVTVADDGGSSGRLRREQHMLPPGDIRNCLLALSDGDPLLARLFNFRFDGEGETPGHNLGNLILTALTKLGKGFDEAVAESGRMLTIRGQVFPSTLDHVTLRAEFADGRSVEGESNIARARGAIRRLHLEPADARAVPQALSALEAADLIVIGPGSLYTSLIPILLVNDIREVLGRSGGRIVLVANLMTEPGETDGYTAADHLEAIRRHAPRVGIHDVLVNTAPIPKDLADRYAAGGAVPVPPTPEAIQAGGCRPVERALLARGPKIRHDPRKVARVLLELGPLQADAARA